MRSIFIKGFFRELDPPQHIFIDRKLCRTAVMDVGAGGSGDAVLRSGLVEEPGGECDAGR